MAVGDWDDRPFPEAMAQDLLLTWDRWVARFDQADNEHPFRYGVDRRKPAREVQQADRALLCQVALYLMERDSVSRDVLDTDRSDDELSMSVVPVNVGWAQIGRFLNLLAKNGRLDAAQGLEAAGPAQRQEMAKYFWGTKSPFVQDLISYLFSPGVVDRAFRDWNRHVLNRFVDSHDMSASAPGSIRWLVADYLDAVAGDSLHQLGVAIAATLPRHPLVTSLMRDNRVYETACWEFLIEEVFRYLSAGESRQTSLATDIAAMLRVVLVGAHHDLVSAGRYVSYEREHILTAVELMAEARINRYLAQARVKPEGADADDGADPFMGLPDL